jgi:hypothetical protein
VVGAPQDAVRWSPSVMAMHAETPAESCGWLGAMATWSTDLSHCAPQDATDVPLAARRRGQFCRDVVEAATSRRAGPTWRCAVRCVGRIGRKRCGGWLDVAYAPGRAVEWSCEVCGERGVITGLEGSASDLSRYAPRGKTRVWGMDEEERSLLRAATSSIPELRVLVSRGTPREDIPGLLLVEATVAELDELYALVAALMDARGGRRRREILDGLLRSLCTAIDGF